MTNLSKFGEDFLKLALRIDKHISGYVDFYIGPEKIRNLVANESIISPVLLLNDSNRLLKDLERQGYDSKRERYLRKLLIAFENSIKCIIGIDMPFRDLFFNLYDVELKPIKESNLDNLKEEIYEAYLTQGNLKDHMIKLRARRAIPPSKVFEFFKKALTIVREKTIELFPDLLPDGENIRIDLVEEDNINKAKWAYYAWYLGNYGSRIEVNPNYNIFWSTLLSGSAHEGYPGHHTEFALKEYFLYRKLDQFEHSILILNSPKLIISEGIATLAINVLFNYQQQTEISLKSFCLNKEQEDSFERLYKQFYLKRKIEDFWFNFGYYYLIEKWGERELIRFAKDYEIFSEEIIVNQFKLLKNQVYATTTLSYNLGSTIIMNKYGEFPSVNNFKYLLVNPILPSDLI